MTAPAAWAVDETKYPDLKGQWVRVGNPNWAPPGAPRPPLTPEYQAVFDANRAEMAAGGPGDVPSWYCLPQGMPMMMNIYDGNRRHARDHLHPDQSRQRLLSAHLHR